MKVYVISLSWPLVELETRYKLIAYSELLLLQNKTDNLFIYCLNMLFKCFLSHCLKTWYASECKAIRRLRNAKTNFSDVF